MAARLIFSRDYTGGGGFYPMLSPSGLLLAHGWGRAIVVDLATGQERSIVIPGESRIQPAGWSAESLVVATGGATLPGSVFQVNPLTGYVQGGPMGIIPAESTPQWSDGHLMIGSGLDLWIDGAPVTACPTHWNSRLCWPWALIPVPQQQASTLLNVATGETITLRSPEPVTSALAMLDGVPVITERIDLRGGLNAPAYWSMSAGRVRLDVMPAQAQNESAPSVVRHAGILWAATVTEHMPDDNRTSESTHVYLRPVGDKSVIDLAVDFACDVRLHSVGAALRVVTTDAVGHVRVYDVSPDEPRATIPTPRYLRSPRAHLFVTEQGGAKNVLLGAVADTGSGDIADYRYYVDAVRCAAQENKPTHLERVAVGPHSAFALVVGVNGERYSTPVAFFDVATAPVDVPVDIPSTPQTPEVVTPVEPPKPDKAIWPPRVKGLVAGFGSPLGAAQLDAIAAKGFNAIRTDVQRSTPAQLAAVVSEMDRPDLWPIYIARSTATMRALPVGALVEWGNEPEQTDALAYAAEVRTALATATERAQALIIGAVGNLAVYNLTWLRTVVLALQASGDWPRIAAVSWHRYPETPDQNPRTPHPGYGSREAEYAALLSIVGDTPTLCTEAGYHLAKTRYGGFLWWGWKTRQLTEAQQAEYLRFDRAFCDEAPRCLGMCVYQLNDGPYAKPIDHFGIRRLDDDAWRPSADIFTTR